MSLKTKSLINFFFGISVCILAGLGLTGCGDGGPEEISAQFHTCLQGDVCIELGIGTDLSLREALLSCMAAEEIGSQGCIDLRAGPVGYCKNMLGFTESLDEPEAKRYYYGSTYDDTSAQNQCEQSWQGTYVDL